MSVPRGQLSTYTQPCDPVYDISVKTSQPMNLSIDESYFQCSISRMHGLPLKAEKAVVYEPTTLSKNLTVAG
jgi:hypothetical protein